MQTIKNQSVVTVQGLESLHAPRHTESPETVSRSYGQIYTHQIENFKLQSGTVLSRAQIGFTVYATDEGKAIDLSRFEYPEQLLQRPIVLVHPALTGSACAHVPAGVRASQGDGWAKNWFAPDHAEGQPTKGAFLDSDKFTIVCVEHFAGNGVESSTAAADLPREIREQVRFADGVRLIAQSLQERGVVNLHAVVGGSIGGGQAFEWLFQDRVTVERIFDISGSAAQDKEAREFFRIQRDILHPSFSSGPVAAALKNNLSDLLQHEELRSCDSRIDVDGVRITPFQYLHRLVEQEIRDLSADSSLIERLECARRVGFLKFVPPAFYDGKLDRVGSVEGLRQWFADEGTKLSSRFTPEALESLCNMNLHAASFTPQQVAERLRETGTRLIGYYVFGDTLFPGERQQRYYEDIANRLTPAEHERYLFAIGVTDKQSGHDHFLTSQFTRRGARLLGQQL